MKHAGPGSLDQLAELLAALRQLSALKERSRGVFYLKSAAFLHFHEDPAGLFADLRLDASWNRLPVNTPAQRRALASKVKAALKRIES